MRQMLRAMVVGVSMLFMGGCAELLIEYDTGAAVELMGEIRTKGKEVSDKVLNSAADAADKYCFTLPIVRDWLRDEINSRTEKATVLVICPGDEFPTEPLEPEEVVSG